jgi:tRNA threonylcarbamoyladenosine biosynthesis protein TsaB
VLVLAFDTATPAGTCALTRDGELIGEASAAPVEVLAAAEELLAGAGFEPADLGGVVVGIGPGSFTGLRLGIAAARGLQLALGIPAAGVSTLEVLAAAAPGALPVIDARRREVFVLLGGRPSAIAPEELELERGTVCVGGGALRYRELLESRGAVVPPDGDEAHVPRARFHAELARDFGPADRIEPLYLRVPDAERAGAGRARS